MDNDNDCAAIIQPPSRLKDRICGTGEGLTIEEILRRSDMIVARTMRQWRDAALAEATDMMRAISAAGAAGWAAEASRIMASALEIEEQADAFGYHDIRMAAADLRIAIDRIDLAGDGGDDGSLRGQIESVTASLAMLRRRISEARYAAPGDGDLLLTAA